MKGRHTIPPSSSVSSVVKGFSVTQAGSGAQIAQARELFLEYAQTSASASAFKTSTRNWQRFPVTMRHQMAVCCSRNTKANPRVASRCISLRREFVR